MADTNTNTLNALSEDQLMAQLHAGWLARCESFGLRPGTEAYAESQGAFMQGALSAALLCGGLTEARVSMLGFMIAIGRCDEYLEACAERAKAV